MSHNVAETAQSLPKLDWARHKATIEGLYLRQKNTLKEVMKAMEARGFKASEQQYKIKFNEWGFFKNKRGGENRNGRGNFNRGHVEGTVTAFRGQPEPTPRPAPDRDMLVTSIGHDSFPIWDNGLDGDLDGALGLNAGVGMVDDTDNFNTLYLQNNFALNLGNSQTQGVSAPATSTKTRQPIHLAAGSGNLAMLELFLETNPSCAGIAGTDGATAIGLAAEKGHLGIVNLLLTYDGVDVNGAAKDTFRTPIHQAAQGGHTGIVRALLSHGALADPADDEKITPLWSAAQQGYHEIVQLLIGAGADKEASSTDGARRPIHQASQNGHLEVVRILLEAGAKVDPHVDSYSQETPSPLWLAAQQGHCEVARLLIRHGANVNFSIHPSKRFPIHQAAQSGYVEMVNILVQSKADVNAREVDDWPPLMIAAQINCAEIIDILLRNGANVNAEEKDGATALWIASQQGHAQVIKKLLEHEAKSFPARSSQRLPVHQAAQNGHLEAVKILLDVNLEDVHAEDKKGSDPLLLASQGETPGHLEVARYLIKNGAKVVT